MLNIKTFLISCVGFIAGITSGLLGAGGGIIVVPSLMALGLKQKESHTASVCIMLPICVISSVLYLKSGAVTLEQVKPYILPGIAGAIAGSTFLPRIDQTFLRKIFACFSLWAGFRMIFR